jgi:CheY-like chemotaxis protein
VREAANGQEAIDIWTEWEPHLIWMDMRMPVMDGHEATRRIKATEKGKATVIVALTASTFEEEREKILADGCDDFLRKPFRDIILFEVMRKHLGVDFVYEDEPVPTAAAPLDAAQLAALPKALKDQLSEALTALDMQAIEAAIEAIGQHDVALGQALMALAKKFEYRPIIDMLMSCDGS